MLGCTARNVSLILLAGLLAAPALADPPVIDDQMFSVAEDAAIDDVVGMVVATDADLDPITLAITGGTGDGIFALDGDNIVVAAALDFETTNSYTLDIEATADGETDTAVITIDVTDAPDDPVVADQSFNVAENAAIGTVVGTVLATDQDNDIASYAFVGASAEFDIAAGTGEITTLVELDFEGTASYMLDVIVTDGNGGTDTATMTINVDDGDDDPVVADQMFNVNENEAVGTEVGTVVATDQDNDIDSFVFNPASTEFSIDSSTGVIETLVELDFENTSSYMLTVEVTDTQGGSDTATITIDVNAVNEAPVVNDQTLDVDENLPIGTVVGNVVASDPENDALAFSFTSASSVFAISNAGEVTTLVVLDHEDVATYMLTVQVADGGLLTDTATLTIDVNDANDNPVVDDQSFSVDENAAIGTVVGTVAASDQDGGDLSFAFNPASTDFAIDANSGEITTLVSFDHETTPSVMVTVEVMDNTALTDTATITIDINDVNESPAMLDQNFNVDENVAIGTAVGNIVATDPDAGDTQSFTVTGGTGQGVFAVATDGSITTAVDLDHETTDSYTLNVTVTDIGMLTAMAEMTIAINDVNEAPVIDDQMFDVDENVALNTSVGFAQASDVDDGDTRTFQITGASVAGVFGIDTNSGEITTLMPIDFETVPSYTLTVEVMDAGGLTDDAQITIDINDLNEAPTAVCVASPFVLDSTVMCNNTAVAADLDGGSFDLDAGDVITLSISPEGPYVVGNTIVTLTVTDALGLSDSCQVTVQVLGADCNLNTFPDSCDIELGVSEDCNLNAVPDECDVDAGDPDGDGRVSRDMPADGVPDECQATTLFVDASAAGSEFGVDWDNAYTDLQDALRVGRNPANAVTAIHVADGIYKPTSGTDRSISFEMSNGRSLLGGFAGSGAVDPDARDPMTFVTTLSGDLGLPDFFQDTRHIVVANDVDASTELSGFTITGGLANDPESLEGGVHLQMHNSSLQVQQVRFVDAITAFSGGCVLIDGGSPSFTNCVFTEGRASRNGGGVYVRDATVAITDCNFTLCDAANRGGAIGLESGMLTLDNCQVINNSAGTGGGLANAGGLLQARYCQFSNNQADFAGGLGLTNGEALVYSCLVTDNLASTDGGAFIVGGPLQPAVVTLLNVLVTNNTATGEGGAVVVDGEGRATILNTTIAENAAASVPGVVARSGVLTVGNTILANNPAAGATEAEQLTNVDATLAVSTSLVEGLTQFAGNGNVGGDPLFAPGTFRLQMASPAIDIGDNALLPPDVLDLDDDGDTVEETPLDALAMLRRAQTSATLSGAGLAPFVDLGAFEFQADCDMNGLDDADEIAADPTLDCNRNGIKDVCDPDCDLNGVPDDCDVNPADPDGDGVVVADCNGNGIPDSCDIAAMVSEDCDANGIPDECESDRDGDGTIDACDGCPDDSSKLLAGACGCGVPETDGDGDSVLDCFDQCQGQDDTIDSDADGVADCLDLCPTDPAKTNPGECGCNVPETDTDGDGKPDCVDNCPDVPGPGDDADADGLGDICDNCPDTPNPDQADSDSDGLGDVCDPTPVPPTPTPPAPTPQEEERVEVEVPEIVTPIVAPAPAGPGSSAAGDNPLGDPPPVEDDQVEQDVPEEMVPVGCGAGCGAGAMPMMPFLLVMMHGLRRRTRRTRQ